jgi:hypothetical protein
LGSAEVYGQAGGESQRSDTLEEYDTDESHTEDNTKAREQVGGRGVYAVERTAAE